VPHSILRPPSMKKQWMRINDVSNIDCHVTVAKKKRQLNYVYHIFPTGCTTPNQSLIGIWYPPWFWSEAVILGQIGLKFRSLDQKYKHPFWPQNTERSNQGNQYFKHGRPTVCVGDVCFALLHYLYVRLSWNTDDKHEDRTLLVFNEANNKAHVLIKDRIQ